MIELIKDGTGYKLKIWQDGQVQVVEITGWGFQELKDAVWNIVEDEKPDWGIGPRYTTTHPKKLKREPKVVEK